MANQGTILEKIVNLTRDNQIQWKNFKKNPPKRSLGPVDFKRVIIASKYPKKVMPVQGGVNKYQSYYAFHDQLVLVLTKGSLDDQLLLIVGEVNLTAPRATVRKKYKKRDFTVKLHVFGGPENSNQLDELHELAHKVPNLEESHNESAMDWLAEQL